MIRAGLRVRGALGGGTAPALRCGALVAILALTLGAGCSDDGDDPPSDGDAGAAGRTQDDDGSAGDGAGRGGSGASAGTSGAGRGGGSGSGGRDGNAGGSGRDDGDAGEGAGTGGAGSAGEGDAGEGVPDNRCNGDGDCVLCTVPLSAEMPCCDGCPGVKSQAQCDAERAAAADECEPDMRPICPAILCVAPGTPKCEDGMCVSVPGIEQ